MCTCLKNVLQYTIQSSCCYTACYECRGIRKYRTEDAQLEWREDDGAQTELKLSVEKVLRLIYEEHYEVPFIGMYRKEVCSIALQQCGSDMPPPAIRQLSPARTCRHSQRGVELLMHSCSPVSKGCCRWLFELMLRSA